MIAIVDYGAGNLFSVHNALRYLGLHSVVTCKPEELEKSDQIILPGVGAFPDAMQKLKERGLVETLCAQAAIKPLLGICLGMQLLFEESSENGQCKGLGLIPGRVVKIDTEGLKIPHMGWNRLRIRQSSPLTASLSDNAFTYFVHSYRADTLAQYIVADCDYGQQVPAIVLSGCVYGAQFHPEKSGETGLSILKAFAALGKRQGREDVC